MSDGKLKSLFNGGSSKEAKEAKEEEDKNKVVSISIVDERNEEPEETEKDKIAELEKTIKGLRSQIELLKKQSAPKVAPDNSNKVLVKALTQLATMREDFINLCTGIENKINEMKAEDVLSSFESYLVDIENILGDAGVKMTHFPSDTADANIQRIVDMVDTEEKDMNGKIAERLSEGYVMGETVLLKEKVIIYRCTENEETISKPINETTVKTEEKE